MLRNIKEQNLTNITDSADRHRATLKSQLLDEADWDDSAPGMASPTKHPIDARHLAAMDSLERRMEWWGEWWWRGNWKERYATHLWQRFGRCGVYNLRAPRHKNC